MAADDSNNRFFWQSAACRSRSLCSSSSDSARAQAPWRPSAQQGVMRKAPCLRLPGLVSFVRPSARCQFLSANGSPASASTTSHRRPGQVCAAQAVCWPRQILPDNICNSHIPQRADCITTGHPVCSVLQHPKLHSGSGADDSSEFQQRCCSPTVDQALSPSVRR